MEFAVVIERAEHNYAAYVPDLPGCVSTGHTLEEVQDRIREAISEHVEALRSLGSPVPSPTTRVIYVGAA